MKHVWILNHYAQEPGGPGGTRHYSLARHLPSYGWSASIIAASTEHNTGRQRLLQEERTRIDIHDDVPFLWLRDTPYKGNGLGRMGNMISYAYAALKRDNLQTLQLPDAIIGSSVHPFAAWAGRQLSRRYNAPFLFEVRDLWPQTLIDMGRLGYHSPLAIMLRKLEKTLYRSATNIITVLPYAGDYIELLGIARDKIVWISNGVEIGDLPSNPPQSDKFTLMYLGAHGAANGLDTLIEAMSILDQCEQAKHVQLRLIGDGPLKSSLIAAASKKGLSNISFEKPIPKYRITEVASEADAFVICVKDLPNLYRFGISMNKLFDYMAAARPTIIAVRAANNPIDESEGGLTVPPENPEELARAILDMAQLPLSRRIEIGKAARRHVEENYSFDRLAAKLAKTLDASLGRQ